MPTSILYLRWSGVCKNYFGFFYYFLRGVKRLVKHGLQYQLRLPGCRVNWVRGNIALHNLHWSKCKASLKCAIYKTPNAIASLCIASSINSSSALALGKHLSFKSRYAMLVLKLLPSKKRLAIVGVIPLAT